jgi:hypothetical protein
MWPEFVVAYMAENKQWKAQRLLKHAKPGTPVFKLMEELGSGLAQDWRDGGTKVVPVILLYCYYPQLSLV